jgi:DNA polymerase III subunit chi
MSEVLFYHLERRSLDEALPPLVEKTLERGWKALIRADTAERADAIDTRLWAFAEDSFLPHAQQGDGEAGRQPVLITVEGGNPNQADVLFLIGGEVPDWAGEEAKAYVRIVLMFDGRDPAAVEIARAAWKGARGAGHDVTYWKENSGGKWEKQG